MAVQLVSPKLVIPPQEADSAWKDILDVYFRDFMEFCLPAVAEKIDWTKGFISLDKELQRIYQDSRVRGKIVDKLMKIWSIDGEETWLLIHLEVQSTRDPHFSERMFIYDYRLFDLYKVPIISIAILIDNNLNWRPSYFRKEVGGCYTEMRYLVVKILDYKGRRQELENLKSPFALVILAQLAVLETHNDPRNRLQAKIALTRRLFEQGFQKEKIIQLYTFIDWLITLPEGLMLEYKQLAVEIGEEQHMTYISTWERIGLKQGLEQGVQKGEAALIIRLLTRRFGEIPLIYLKKIYNSDAQALLILGEKILDAATLAEIFD